MRKLVVISLFILAAFAVERLNITPIQEIGANEVADSQREQLIRNCHYNVDAEPTSSLEIPSARTIVIKSPRTQSSRAPHIATAGHFYTTSKYVVARFIHRLGSLTRAVDFYLYTLCQLRL